MRNIPLFIFSGLLAFAGDLSFAAPPDRARLTVVKADVDEAWNREFSGKEGWIGGDGVYSVQLSPGRIVWLFGDTFIGKVKQGRRVDASMVNNTLALQTGHGNDATLRFVTGETEQKKSAAFFTPADGKGWFWPQAALRIGRDLFIFLPQIEKTRQGGAFGFKQTGQWLIEIDNPDAEPEQWHITQHKIPFAIFEPGHTRSWGSALLADGDDIYIYGFDESPPGLGHKRLIIAKTSAEKLADFTSWRFRTAGAWSATPADAAPSIPNLAAEFSVTRAPTGKGYILVCTQSGLSDRIDGRFASTPDGPWSAPTLLYKCPEMSQDKGVFSYAAKAHPWGVSGNELLISYCVNTWEFARVFQDQSLYRPKFVRVQLLPASDE